MNWGKCFIAWGSLKLFLSFLWKWANLTANLSKILSTHFLTSIGSSISAFLAAILPSITTAASSSNLFPSSIIWFSRRYSSLNVDTLVRTMLSDHLYVVMAWMSPVYIVQALLFIYFQKRLPRLNSPSDKEKSWSIYLLDTKYLCFLLRFPCPQPSLKHYLLGIYSCRECRLFSALLILWWSADKL